MRQPGENSAGRAAGVSGQRTTKASAVLTAAQLYNMEGMTMLPGIDDYPKKTEVTYLPDAQTMLNFD
jgi:hypothetical protein